MVRVQLAAGEIEMHPATRAVPAQDGRALGPCAAPQGDTQWVSRFAPGVRLCVEVMPSRWEVALVVSNPDYGNVLPTVRFPPDWFRNNGGGSSG